MATDLPNLLPGDILLYGPSNLIGRLICVKTWSHVCHCEVYAGGGFSVASRDGIGVGKYPLRTEQLKAVLRPVGKLSMTSAMRWFYGSANGQRYDFLGLMVFFLAVKRGSPDRMFCSEFAVRFMRKAKVPVVNLNWDADKTAPGDLLKSTSLNWVLWKDVR